MRNGESLYEWLHFRLPRHVSPAKIGFFPKRFQNPFRCLSKCFLISDSLILLLLLLLKFAISVWGHSAHKHRAVDHF